MTLSTSLTAMVTGYNDQHIKYLWAEVATQIQMPLTVLGFPPGTTIGELQQKDNKNRTILMNTMAQVIQMESFAVKEAEAKSKSVLVGLDGKALNAEVKGEKHED